VLLTEANSLEATAVALLGVADSEGFPSPSQWEAARPLRFCSDWQGKHPDPQRETEVRLLWTPETLFLKFRARYRTITVFPDAAPTGRRDQLWDRDVAEVFLQPNRADPWRYFEFEVSPNGMWLDLAIAPDEKIDLQSELRRRAVLHEHDNVWTAELAIPMKCLVAPFAPKAVWRANFFRVEGAAEPRCYSAWRPTNTPEPNFHVPAAFGALTFASPNSQ
jgi:alpha-galactosidase